MYLIVSQNALFNIFLVEGKEQLVQSTNRHTLTTKMDTAVHGKYHLSSITLK